jgi:hypothetical protein
MMAGILIVYIRVLISWGITCVIFNLGGTRASAAFFDAFDVELGTLSPAHRAFVRVEKAGTHVSNFDWRRPNVWSTPEYQIQTVSKSAKDTGRFLRQFFLEVASHNCILRGIVEPRGPSFFDTLVEDNLRARYVQNIRSMEYSARVEELAGFFRDQRWMHMHSVLRSQGITFEELGRQGREAALAFLERQGGYTGEDGAASASTEFGRRGGEASIKALVAILEAEGFTRIEALRSIGVRLRGGTLASLEVQGFTGEDGTRSASTELGHRGRGGALASLETQGFTGEGGVASASTELGHRGRGGALASLETQGFTGEGGAASASTELGRRGGEARSAIYRISGDCSYPGCTYAVYSGEFCGKHHPKKPEKSDKCRVCERVFGAKETIRGGVCNTCYKKPEATAARKKATAKKKAARGTCSTQGCNGWNYRGRDKCETCLYPRKSN